VLEDWRTAPMDEGQRAMLDLLAKVTREHEDLDVADIERVREAGVSDEAIVDALYVAFAFNVITRMADTLGWAIPDDISFQRGAQHLWRFGYR
jgi:alkylhydroperoxidase family enzyme